MGATMIQLGKLLKFLERLLGERFYGIIELHCENGRIYRVRKLHNIESEELERLASS